nr:hypothetical protein CoNPh37_CDS0113 [Staphylococcus phage S-CoN_Ph37]
MITIHTVKVYAFIGVCVNQSFACCCVFNCLPPLK